MWPNIWLIDTACFLLFFFCVLGRLFHSAIQRDVAPKALTALLSLFREQANTPAMIHGVMNVTKEKTSYLYPGMYQ